MARPGALLLLAVAAALPGARGFYLPGSYPHKYNPRDYLNVDLDGGRRGCAGAGAGGGEGAGLEAEEGGAAGGVVERKRARTCGRKK